VPAGKIKTFDRRGRLTDAGEAGLVARQVGQCPSDQRMPFDHEHPHDVGTGDGVTGNPSRHESSKDITKILLSRKDYWHPA
jgi:hypothetical protein